MRLPCGCIFSEMRARSARHDSRSDNASTKHQWPLVLLFARAELRTFAELDHASSDCILGINDFSDDDSVHADHWECHPEGDETLCVLEGRLLVVIEQEDDTRQVVIEKGQTFIVPRACWHRLQVLEPGRLLFFTPAAATELRPRA